jgi:DNA polymerase-3 subunit epsilon
MRFNPGIHIPETSSKVHGIYDKDVADCPTFIDMAARLADTFRGCDLAGFNSNRFDIPMLAEEFARAAVDMNFSECQMVDVQNIYHRLEQRTLVAAYRFYCGKKLENAHSALADTQATKEVLEAQLEKYPDELKNDIAFLAEFSQKEKNVDLAGRFVYDANHNEMVNFGKYKGKSVREVLLRDPGYYGWIMQGDFTLNTKQVLTKLKLKYMSR